jgi:hypothetical protein
MSRVLLAGVAIAGAAATTSAFTSGNSFSADGGAVDDTAGYGELAVSGITVTNVAYNPVGSDASLLDDIVFTVNESALDMKALLTLHAGATAVFSSDSVDACTPTTVGTTYTITCEVPDTQAIQPITKVGLTVVAK